MSWAHPEFGTLLASSSFDRSVKIWEQIVSSDPELLQTNGAVGPSSSSRWVERALLTDGKGTPRAVEFAPQHLGLKLVSQLCSQVSTAGGILTFYYRRLFHLTITFACMNVLSNHHCLPGNCPRSSMCSLCPRLLRTQRQYRRLSHLQPLHRR